MMINFQFAGVGGNGISAVERCLIKCLCLNKLNRLRGGNRGGGGGWKFMFDTLNLKAFSFESL
jgi:hypothetical protein